MLSRTRMSGAIVALLLVLTLPALSQAPTFQTQTYPANASSSFGVSADLNQDGALDFVINGTLDGPCGTCIILSNGDGTYRPPVAYDASAVPLATGDLNGDGHADVVFAGGIAYGNGDGTLRPFVAFTDFVGSNMAKAAVADFNGDGRQDIAVMTIEHTGGVNHTDVYVLINNGDGTFTSHPYAEETFWHDPSSGLDADFTPMNLEVGDFDADGRPDVVYTVGAKTDESGWPPNHSKIVALFNNGGGALTTSRVVKEADTFLQGIVGDMNQDGKSDVVTQALQCGATTCTTAIDIFYGASGRTFTERLNVTDGYAFGFPEIADFNGDHRPDVAMLTGDFPTDSFGIKVFTQNADGSFTAGSPYALGDYHSCRGCGPIASYLFAGDFNRDHKPDLATVGHDESVLRLALNTTSSSGFPTCLHPGGRGINVCAPASGGTVASPVSFSIGASDFKAIRKLEIWVDGAKQKETYFSFADYSYLDTSLPLANGSHKLSVYAAGFDNLLQKKSLTFTVDSSGGGTCSQPSTSTAVVICAPTSGSTVTAPVHVSAAGGSAVTFMEVWLDGSKMFQNSGNRVSTDLPLGNGTHTMKVYGRNGSVVGQASVTFTVGSGGSTCSQPTSSTGTVICAPANGSTVSSPVTLQARGGVNVTFMEAWVDGTKRYQGSGSSVFTSVTLATGTHRLTVYSKNGSGVLSSATSNFTVH